MSPRLDAQVLDGLFREARSRNAWVAETLPDETWRELYDLMKFGPTSANTSPARFVFVTSVEAKAKLGPLLSAGNQKALQAPCIVIIGHDLGFAAQLAHLFPHNSDVKSWFAAPTVRDATALRNGTLQGAYLIVAARALGLDAGPMSGFDAPGVDAAFFAGTEIKSNFLVALGHGADTPHPRLPRLSFEDAARIL